MKDVASCHPLVYAGRDSGPFKTTNLLHFSTLNPFLVSRCPSSACVCADQVLVALSTTNSTIIVSVTHLLTLFSVLFCHIIVILYNSKKARSKVVFSESLHSLKHKRKARPSTSTSSPATLASTCIFFSLHLKLVRDDDIILWRLCPSYTYSSFLTRKGIARHYNDCRPDRYPSRTKSTVRSDLTQK